MAYEVRLHPNVAGFLDSLPDKERKRCVESLSSLESDPFRARSGTDIKKLKGKLHDLYRLRVGDLRFEYFIESNYCMGRKGF